MLAADALDTTNEDADNVRIEPIAVQNGVVTLPAASMAALVWEAAPGNGPASRGDD